MDVNTLRDRVLEVSHDENAPDTELSTKALRWLNSAYIEIVEQCRSYLEPWLQKRATLTLTGGSGTLPADVKKVIAVQNSETGQTFSAVHVSDSRDIQISAQPATRYWVIENVLYTNTTQTTPVTVIYSAKVAELVAGGSEADIVLPPEYHPGLIWGGLLWSSIYERGFNSASEINLFQAKWDEARREIKMGLMATSSGINRVNSYDILDG